MKVKAPPMRMRRVSPKPAPLPPRPVLRARGMAAPGLDTPGLDAPGPTAPGSDGAARHELDTIAVAPAAGEPIQMRERDDHRPNDLPIPSPQNGRPLPMATRAKMEQAFGHDFSAIRVHEGSEPARIGADAYARGNDIHFSPGAFHPASPDGERLLGHELAHVVQQRAGRVRPPGGGGAPINADAALEAEADALGEKAAQGERVATGAGGGAIAPESAPIQRGRRKKRNNTTKTPRKKEKEKEKKREKSRKDSTKSSIKESRRSISPDRSEEDDNGVNNKRKYSEVKKNDVEDSDEPKKKKKRTEDSDDKKKKKSVKRKPKKVSKNREESYDDNGDEDYVDGDTMDKNLEREYGKGYGEKGSRKKKDTLDDIFQEMKTSRTMAPPKDPDDFYGRVMSMPGFGEVMRSLSSQSMTEYKSGMHNQKTLTNSQVRKHAKHTAKTLHKDEEKDTEKYYGTRFDQHALSLNDLSDITWFSTKENIPEKENSSLWRDVTPDISLQPKGRLVTTFPGEDDYNSISNTLQGGVNRNDVTPMEIGEILNSPDPKSGYKKIKSIRKKGNNEDSKTYGYLNNLLYTERSVEQARNPEIGPFLGMRNSQIGYGTIPINQGLGKTGKSGMVTYPGSGTSKNKEKRLTQELISDSMRHIEKQNLDDTELGTRSKKMVGTKRNLKKHAYSSRDLMKSYARKEGKELREGTPEPSDWDSAQRNYKFNLMRTYGAMNDRDVTMDPETYEIKISNSFKDDSFSEEEKKEEKNEGKKEKSKSRRKK